MGPGVVVLRSLRTGEVSVCCAQLCYSVSCACNSGIEIGSARLGDALQQHKMQRLTSIGTMYLYLNQRTSQHTRARQNILEFFEAKQPLISRLQVSSVDVTNLRPEFFIRSAVWIEAERYRVPVVRSLLVDTHDDGDISSRLFTRSRVASRTRTPLSRRSSPTSVWRWR